MPVSNNGRVRIEISREELERSLREPSSSVKTEELPSWTETIKGALVTAGLVTVAAVAISRNWEAVYMAGSNFSFNRAMGQCAANLVDQQTSALPGIGGAAQGLFDTVTGAFSGAVGKLGSFVYNNPRLTATAISAYSLFRDHVVLQVTAGVILGAALIKPIKYSCSAMKAAVWPKNNDSITAKVFKVATLSALVLAGIYAMGYREQTLKFGEQYQCPANLQELADFLRGKMAEYVPSIGAGSLSAIEPSATANGTQALISVAANSATSMSEVALFQPAGNAAGEIANLGPLAAAFTPNSKGEFLQQVTAAVKFHAQATGAKVETPAPAKVVEDVWTKISDTTIVAALVSKVQQYALPVLGVTLTGFGWVANRIVNRIR
ncbi:MAG: hypothetical protein JSS30_00375 [Verrucomicrobia bacterium]|nr:hypothetical protein [Verrucomicrobiota bacterium]